MHICDEYTKHTIHIIKVSMIITTLHIIKTKNKTYVITLSK